MQEHEKIVGVAIWGVQEVEDDKGRVALTSSAVCK